MGVHNGLSQSQYTYSVHRANLTTQVTAPHVFWAIDASNGNLVWRMSFERVELFIDGEADDFNGIYDAFRDLELRLCAFSR